jgi:uncharacterized protein
MNQTVLITGASSGIGEAFAKHLAAQNHNLVLIARREEQLNTLAKSLIDTYPIRVTFIAADLTQPKACENIFRDLQNENIHIDYLINSAGFGQAKTFATQTLTTLESMIDLNIKALTT